MSQNLTQPEEIDHILMAMAGHGINPNSSLDEPAMWNQWVVGRVLTRHVGLKPDLRSNELSGIKAGTLVADGAQLNGAIHGFGSDEPIGVAGFPCGIAHKKSALSDP